jgi:hypothetical protein
MVRATVAACILLLAPASPAHALLEPLVVDQEQIFEITWKVGEFEGRPQLSGRIDNASFFGASKIQLLVDQLDASGRIVGQQLAWLGVVLLPGERSYFDVPVPDAKAPYNVRVYAWVRSFGTRPK